MSDRELLQQFVGTGSQDAFARVVAMHVDMVHTAAARMVRRGGRDAHLAEDVTQAVFILLAKRAPQLKPNVILAGWLYEATRLSASVALRAQRRRQRHEAAAAVEAQRMRGQSDQTSSDAASTWQQMEPLIDDAMGKLSTADRDAIALRFFRNKSMAEAGQALGITEDAAKMRVSRAVGRLRKLLARAGVTAPLPAVMSAIVAAGPHAAPVGLGQSAATAALAATAAVGGKLGLSYTIAKGANAMITWIKIKFAVTAMVVVLVVGTGAAVVGQTLHKFHEPVLPVVASTTAPPATTAPVASAAPAADSGALAAAAPLTLDIGGVDPRTALDAIANASGAKFEIWPDSAWTPQFMGFGKPMPKVTLHADGQPLWAVLRDFCQQAKARPQEMGDRGNTITIGTDDNNSFSQNPAFAGPTHLVVLSSISRSNTVRFEQDRTVHEDRGASIDVWIDPRINVLHASHGVWIDSAVDEHGTSLVVPHDKTWDEFYMGGFTPWHLSLSFPLNYDWTRNKVLKQLSGHARIIVPSKTETIEFPDLLNAKGTEKSAGGVRMVINYVQVQPHQLEYHATIYRGSGLSTERWKDIKEQTRQGIVLSDAKGTRLGEGGSANGDDRQAQVGLSMGFSTDAVKPVKLAWHVAMESQAVDLPFEFHDLPLP
jgi:RNA polymerase sigma factor (sigma-70 family)